MLKTGNNGNDLLQILDVIVGIEQENINDCAEYFASISAICDSRVILKGGQ